MKLNRGSLKYNYVGVEPCLYPLDDRKHIGYRGQTHGLAPTKKLLIAILLIFILPLTIYANSGFEYKISTNNPNPYLKEATIVTIDINQTDHKSVMFFHFFVTKKSHYKSKQIHLKENNSYHNRNKRYTYLIYPLSIGDIDIEFSLTKKLTTDDSVAYSFSGDRDNVKGLVTNDTTIHLPNLKLQVKPIPNNTIFVGDFALHYKLSKHTAQAYEPIPLNIELQGRGYPPIIETKSILPQNTEFTQFVEAPIVESHIVDKDTQSSIKYATALSHSQSFTLEPINLKAFNPKTQKSYILSIPQQDFTIINRDKSTLIDQINSPPPLEIDYRYMWTLLGYILSFGAGFLSAFLIFFKHKSKKY